MIIAGKDEGNGIALTPNCVPAASMKLLYHLEVHRRQFQ